MAKVISAHTFQEILNLNLLLADLFIKDPSQRKKQRMDGSISLTPDTIRQISIIISCHKFISEFLSPFGQYS